MYKDSFDSFSYPLTLFVRVVVPNCSGNWISQLLFLKVILEVKGKSYTTDKLKLQNPQFMFKLQLHINRIQLYYNLAACSLFQAALDTNY